MTIEEEIKNRKNYDDFRDYLYNLEVEINKRLKTEGRTKKFSLMDIFYEFDEINAGVHKLILERLVKYGKNEEELTGLIWAVCNSTIGKAYEKRDRESLLELKISKNTNKKHGAEATIYKYMRLYYNKYFKVVDGQVVSTGLDRYDYLNPSESEKKKVYTREYISLLLLSNGECYFSASNHEDLAQWLNAQGKSLKGAVRGTINHKLYRIYISPMGDYNYTSDSKDDKDALLTEAELEALKIIYRTHSSKWAYINSVNDFVMCSNFFGRGKTTDLTENNIKNLKALEDIFEGKEFSVREYKRYLKDQKNQFSGGY